MSSAYLKDISEIASWDYFSSFSLKIRYINLHAFMFRYLHLYFSKISFNKENEKYNRLKKNTNGLV
ncbi:hypothetical protein SacN8_08525 [Sulfolobus acidocaldarius N8]|uniref:Uncharacterized protein n=1 Tax=Sulfolobus acidocaldarius N8 TaxID=1028566 RepID=M1J752_9CREN|nr:hypothetical protein SacN8_08525 [Sulfolobus acidocaldarius N8]